MRISTAEFILGSTSLRQLPKDASHQIAFLGRSNVGKSSLINTICRRKSLARSGSQPGKTQELNYYRINGQFYFVDLPGYGYAKLPEQIRARLGSLIEEYLKTKHGLLFVVQLIDARHEPTALDLMMVGWLDYYEIPFIIVLTKADKIPRSKTNGCLTDARRTFSRFRDCKGVVMFSSVTGEGRLEILKLLSQQIP